MHTSAYITTSLAAAMPWQSLLLPLGVVLILTSLVFSIRKRRQRQLTALTPHETLEKLRQHDGVRGDMEKIMVEVEQMARRVGAQLDAKAIRLERLIDEADRKLAELDARMDGGALASPSSRSRSTFGRSTPNQAGGATSASHRGDTWATGADSLAVEDQGTSASHTGMGAEALSRSVFSLREQGLNPIQIAKQLGEHVGKIELILSLHGA